VLAELTDMVAFVGLLFAIGAAAYILIHRFGTASPATGLSQLSAFDAYCLFGLATGLSDVFRSIVAYSAGISGFEGAAYVC
jgi:hypothetical protein